MRAPETCPVCGSDIPRGARACPECGSDEQTGWSDRATAQSLDIPDDEFDYDDFVAREFGGKKDRRRLHWLWWGTAVLLLLAIFWFWVRR